MGIITTDNRHYNAIASAIRRNKQTLEAFTPAQMADGVDDACTAQYEKGYNAGAQEGHRIEQGVFTPKQDSSSIVLNIPSGAKIIEIIPEGTPSASTGTRIPVRYLFAAELYNDNNAAYPGRGAAVQYESSGFRTTFYPYNTDAGFSVDLDQILVFEAGIPYAWVAHYWSE